MLWYKGWFETRVKLLFIMGFMGSVLAFQYSAATRAQPHGGAIAGFGLEGFLYPTVLLMMCPFLAGAGVATQPSFRSVKGIHGSMLFTLSLPVSRLRLLAVRAGIGFLEVVGVIAVLCCGIWAMSLRTGATVTCVDLLEYSGTMIACASPIYCLAVLLATFLDDQWRLWGTLIVCVGLKRLFTYAHLPVSADLFFAMSKGSPLIVHAVPWAAIAISVGLAAVLFVAAWMVMRAREY